MRRALATLSLLPLVACQCGDESLGVVAPDLEVATDLVAFGEVPVGATKRVSVAVRNRGGADLELVSVDAAAPFGATLPRATLGPGELLSLELFFRPTNDEPQSAFVTLVSDDPDTPMVSIPVSGQGVRGVLTVQPAEVDFDNTKVGLSRTVELVLDNRGLEPVEGTVVPVGFSQPEHFSLTLLSSFVETAPFAVPGRSQQVLELGYRPLSMGRHDGRVVFEICGEGCGLEVEVRASASESVVRLVPAVVDFGEVGIGETRTEQLRLENGGGQPVEVLEVRVSGSPDLGMQLGRALPATVGPDDALGINVELTPSSAAEVMGEVLVVTGPVTEQVRASVIGRGVGPLFRVDPEIIDFGVERTPAQYRRAVLLVNAGSSDVRVTGVSVSGDPAFALDALPGLPVRLGSGESLVVTVLFSPAAIAEYTGTVVVQSDDPTRPRVEVPVRGGLTDRYCELAVSPSRISFGLLPPGYSRRQTAAVENVGTDDCNILAGSFRRPVEPAITEVNQPWPRTLARGDRVEVSFEFAPTVERESKATYVMQTDDPIFPERTVSVFGTSVGNLDVFTDPIAVDFGSMNVGCPTVSQPILLINGGTIDVDIARLTVTSSTSELTLTRAFATPQHLAAGAILPLEVSYAAQDLGVDIGDLEIEVASYGFALNVPLRGAGAQNPRVTDRFEQVRNDKVDVLFVIDDSCSMGDDQTALANNFLSFIQQADVRQVDFRIGITTTTVYPIPGFLVGPIMTRQTSRLEATFQAQANVGISGSGFEQGLEAMLSVLQAADRGQSPQVDLLRPDAARVVVIVSDEDDQSPLPVASYLTELRRHSAQGYTTAMVSGQSVGCQSARGSASPAPRYQDFARLTGGLDESICGTWSNTLANIGQAAFGLRGRFALSRPADQSQQIVVRVNGVARTTGWTYDPADNAVVFAQPPPEGADIEIEFTPRC